MKGLERASRHTVAPVRIEPAPPARLRCSLQLDDRQMLPAAFERDGHLDLRAGSSTHEGLRRGTAGTSGPMRPRLEAWGAAGWPLLEVDLVGSHAAQGSV